MSVPDGPGLNFDSQIKRFWRPRAGLVTAVGPNPPSRCAACQLSCPLPDAFGRRPRSDVLVGQIHGPSVSAITAAGLASHSRFGSLAANHRSWHPRRDSSPCQAASMSVCGKSAPLNINGSPRWRAGISKTVPKIEPRPVSALAVAVEGVERDAGCFRRHVHHFDFY